MKKIISFAIVLLALSACKKDKGEFVPTTVSNAEGYLEYNQVDGDKNTNWYSIKAMDGLSSKSLIGDSEYQESIVFGYYNHADTYGLFSPDNFPKPTEQGNWTTRLPISFRKTTITSNQMQQYRDQYKDGFPVQLILDNWKKGTNEQKSITPIQKDATYAFRSQDGKLTGLIQILTINNVNTNIQFEIWIAK
ncbi:hypothetical protein [Pseudobacter ginsenosidimutans]|uniref:Lipoprotein n=1 Tax=Pseudobacter ginsenosidimutans TaxID=661488 RepID=A0A4Q7MZW1_9BACT|nr:hypothetical protein [Pseudobacter ginsenosidimutans]QEC43455.1 hypothetical protein FSB84_17825 [Pseudobacter ginsenosidimutans]RZS74841.1 hypothetical protein EV199_0692 [Pseudobacter ginsenosidimutans]